MSIPTCVFCDRPVTDMTGSNGGRCHVLHPFRREVERAVESLTVLEPA